jgi:hypothetical protein
MGHSAEHKMLGAVEVKVNAAEKRGDAGTFTTKQKSVACGSQFRPQATLTADKSKALLVFVPPFPVIALLVLIQRGIFAVRLMMGVVVGMINNHFVIIPAMVIVVLFVVIGDPLITSCRHQDCADQD